MFSFSETGLSDFGTCLFIFILLWVFMHLDFEGVIQNPELDIPAPPKRNEESELPQTGPPGSECPE